MADGVQTETIRIVAEDHASHPAERAARAFEATGRAAHGLTERMSGLKQHAVLLASSVAGVGFGFGALAHSVIESNRELENTTKSIAALHFGFESWSKSTSAVDRMTISLSEAHGVVEELEEAESRLATPMAELAQTYRSLAGPAFQRLGMNQEQVLGLFNKTSSAAKALGMSGTEAASTVTRALVTGRVRGVDPLSVALRETIGATKKLGQKELYDRISKGLGQFAPAAALMSQGLDASMFRIRDFLEDTIRDVGTPVFKHIAGIIDQWRTKLEAAKASGHDLIKEFSDKLVRGLETAEKLTKLIVDNWKVLAAIYVANKGFAIASSVAGGLGGMMGGGAGVSGALGGALNGAAGGLSKFASQLTVATTAAYALGKAFEWWIEKKGDERAAQVDRGQKLETSVTAAAVGFKMGGSMDKTGLAHLRSIGLLNESAIPGTMAKKREFNFAEFQRLYEAADYNQKRAFVDKTLGKNAEKQGLSNAESTARVEAAFANLVNRALGRVNETMGPAVPEGFHPPVKPHPVINIDKITISQDFKDADPDRVFIAFKRGLEGLADNPQQSGQGSSHPY